mmetsp:Transcript_23938/g.38194  ORF Transcript_23938/g.38194 Transcript_23938/m.38194 type:complete len:240 (-) Transcript_23938:942-1661(-)
MPMNLGRRAWVICKTASRWLDKLSARCSHLWRYSCFLHTLHLKSDALKVNHNLLSQVPTSVVLQFTDGVKALTKLVVDIQNVNIGNRVWIPSLLVKAHLFDLHNVYKFTLVWGDLSTATNLVWVPVDWAEDKIIHLNLKPEPDHVQLQELAAPITHEGTCHNLILDKMARKVPMVALKVFLTDKKTKSICTTGVVDVCNTVNHQHLASTKLVVDFVHAILRPEYCCPITVHQVDHILFI